MNQDLYHTAQARAAAYAHLAAAFAYPTTELAEALASGALVAALGALSETLPMYAAQPALDIVRGWRAALRSADDILRALESEYTRLFLGPGRPVAHLNESVYLDPNGQMMGECVADLPQLYAEAGLGLDPDLKELPDHLAVELEFMAHLCDAEIEAWSSSDSARASDCAARQAAFLEQHLNRWLGAAARRLSQSASDSLYSALAQVAARFAALDQEWARAIANMTDFKPLYDSPQT